MKSFRNLILSLFLAAGVAGFTACSDGNMGPAGPQGPAGAPGAPGPKGDAGEAGKTADEIPRKYDFLKSWGESDGMVACNDDVLKMMDAFPGKSALTKMPSAGTAQAITPNVTANDPNQGECSSKVFPTTGAVFTFNPTHGTAADNMTETRTGTASVGPSNPTQTTITKSYMGGTVTVTFNQNFPELADRELLFTRCGKGKKPSNNSLMGEYRIERTDELEQVIETVNGVRGPKADTNVPGNAAYKSYNVSKWETKVCVRFSPVGTVKCYVRTNAERRGSNGETVLNTGGSAANRPTRTVTEQVALYKNGQLTQLEPKYANNLLPGSGATTGNFPFGAGTANTPANLDAGGKLCNLFDKGVVPCSGTTKLPNTDRLGGCA